MKITKEILHNRKAFLHELRTTTRKKGTIKSDPKGRPVFESEEDKDGACACAIMTEMFGDTNGKLSLPKAVKALGITSKECRYIQQELNDTPLLFPEIADKIETELFNC